MCLQDLAISSGLRLTTHKLTTDGNGNVDLPGLRRAVLIFTKPPSGSCFFYSQLGAGVEYAVPFDTRFSVNQNNTPVYSRESLGPFLYGPLYLRSGAAGEEVIVQVYEFDAQTDSQVNAMLQGRV